MATPSAMAFALLGPFESWMEETNGLRQPGDIGGPMDITNGYRWNVPVLTYGFDQSFLDFFGSNGVAAVKSAVQILNDVPPASQIVPTNFPFNSQNLNYAAQAKYLYDLKSETLSLLLEQMGLAQSTRYIFVLRQWNPIFLTDPAEGEWPTGTIPNYIVQRNFDPQTFSPSVYVNQCLYSGYVSSGFVTEFSGMPGYGNVINILLVDPLFNYLPVADFLQNTGIFYTGLTYDDVGGLAYLLSTNNVNYETLLPGIAGVGTNANSFVNGAWRPGIDKVTFVSEPIDPLTGEFFSPVTNQFTDTYITNGMVRQQQVARVISRPDILFAAGDINAGVPYVLLYSRTGTTNWINNAALNGNPSGAGPGMIQPPIVITFNKPGRQFVSSGSYSDTVAIDESQFLGSFDASTNAPIAYPISQGGPGTSTVRMWLTIGSTQEHFEWQPASTNGAVFAMQTSTDLANWTTLFTVTNNGSVCTYFVYNPASAQRFYRLVPQ
ncbi:MAG TPA: hypothetical protein VN836_04215 [Verrucomicrobiae bacterium]|nr:hypothetical protein [Verrucomicrobiae bacterium]